MLQIEHCIGCPRACSTCILSPNFKVTRSQFHHTTWQTYGVLYLAQPTAHVIDQQSLILITLWRVENRKRQRRVFYKDLNIVQKIVCMGKYITSCNYTPQNQCEAATTNYDFLEQAMYHYYKYQNFKWKTLIQNDHTMELIVTWHQ